jgi:hypothetical protein
VGHEEDDGDKRPSRADKRAAAKKAALAKAQGDKGG